MFTLYLNLMNESIFFSVVIPCYNVGPTFQEVLDTLKLQTYKNFEIIIVDDGSDLTGKNRLNDSLKLLNLKHALITLNTNQGPGHARDTGAKAAQGEFICFLDSDDYWDPNKLTRVKEIIDAYRPKFIGHYMRKQAYKPKNVNSIIELSLRQYLIRNYIATSALIIKKSDFVPFSSRMRFSEDFDFILKNLESKKLLLVPEFLGELSRLQNSKGGQSCNHLKMRVGEILVYLEFCNRKRTRLILFPGFFAFSIFKHIYKILQRFKNRLLASIHL